MKRIIGSAIVILMISSCGSPNHIDQSPENVLSSYFETAYIEQNADESLYFLTYELSETMMGKKLPMYERFEYVPEITNIQHTNDKATVQYQIIATKNDNQKKATKTASLIYEGGRWLIQSF